ncbi:MAG: hydrolase [Clostridia bacterium]|nr:hydrolase [Clostridia bacterium]
MYDICPVCFWEDNNEFDDPNEYDDCNKMSLNEARKNYLEFGASKKSMKKYCRKPRKSEMNG